MRPTRRQLLVGGGAGVGLVLAWTLWPREYRHNLAPGEGETAFNAHLKIGRDGRVAVAVPQLETGQGILSAFAQILGDELGADWRTIAVEPAPPNPLYGNPVVAAEWGWRGGAFGPTVTGGSSSIRAFEDRLRDAGAGARVLLAREAASRWDVAWEECEAAGGFVVHEGKRLRFAELAEGAAARAVPDPVPRRAPGTGALAGRALPRLDVPAKLDGSALFASDIRLPGMLYAAVRRGPVGSRLVGGDEAAARGVAGVRAVISRETWAAIAAEDAWAAERGLSAFAARWRGTRRIDVDDELDRALTAKGTRVLTRGDPEGVLGEGGAISAAYRVHPAQHAAPETQAAVARLEGGRLEVWGAHAAPELARAALARVADLPLRAVTLYPTLAAGGAGQAFQIDALLQAAELAGQLGVPISVQWSRGEDLRQGATRPPAAIALSARLAPGGALRAWHARVAGPDALAAVAGLLEGREGEADAGLAGAGAVPPYACENLALDWHGAETGMRAGVWRGRSHIAAAFATESFADELARLGGLEPLSFRMGLLGGNPRLARVLATVSAAGGWDGGGPGSRLGLACHAMAGSYAAVLAEAQLEGGRVRVTRLACAADVGRMVNPEGVRQQIEGGLLWGLANAVQRADASREDLPGPQRLGEFGLPRLTDTPAISVELIPSAAAPGGASEIAAPPVAPAIANALFAATGQRLRTLPLLGA